MIRNRHVYFLSDGKPNKDRMVAVGKSAIMRERADYYADLNQNRTHDHPMALIVNTTSLGLTSEWMEMLSAKTMEFTTR